MHVSLQRISPQLISSVTGKDSKPVEERRALNPIPTALNNQRQEGFSPYQMPGRNEAAAPRKLNSPIFADIERKATGEHQGFMSKIFGGGRVEAGNSINNNA